MENCGDDFLAALADATLPTDGWGDLKPIETDRGQLSILATCGPACLSGAVYAACECWN